MTSRDTRRWVIPKGWPIGREAPYASAAREALEEAGVVGKAGRDPMGVYTYEKHRANGSIAICDVQVFPLEVERQQEEWPEKDQREVRWFSLTDAAKAVHEPVLSDIILAAQELSSRIRDQR